MVHGSDLVYLTFTSGITGRPKAIVFRHGALTNLIHWETEGLTRSLRWLQFASLGFDVSFHGIFGALCGGGSLCVVDDGARYDHELLTAFFAALPRCGPVNNYGLALAPEAGHVAIAAGPAAAMGGLSGLWGALVSANLVLIAAQSWCFRRHSAAAVVPAMA